MASIYHWRQNLCFSLSSTRISIAVPEDEKQTPTGSENLLSHIYSPPHSINTAFHGTQQTTKMSFTLFAQVYYTEIHPGTSINTMAVFHINLADILSQEIHWLQKSHTELLAMKMEWMEVSNISSYKQPFSFSQTCFSACQ